MTTKKQWAVIKTAIPAGAESSGHISLHGTGLGHGFANSFQAHVVWYPGEEGATLSRIWVDADKLPLNAFLAELEGMMALYLPAGEGSNFIVNYVHNEKEKIYVKDWTIAELTTEALPLESERVPMVMDSSRLTSIQGVMVGHPVEWSSDIIPEGFLALNGQAINPETDPVLAKLYGAQLPDARDCFIRVSSEARIPLTHQDDSFTGDLKFVGEAYSSHGHTLSYRYYKYGSGGSRAAGKRGDDLYPAVGAVTAGTPEGTVAESGEETRPSNFAVQLITKRG